METLKKQLSLLFQKPHYLLVLMVVVPVTVSIQAYTLGEKSYDGNRSYTHYNNYVIFKNSFYHLIEQKNLYKLYPEEHWDYYKYSPTFSLFMGIFAFLPDLPGLILWNLLNSAVLFFAVWKLPVQSNRTKVFILLYVLMELITSLQNAQSNALIAGLMIFAFIYMQKHNHLLASAFIVASVFIKLFGIVALVLFIFYPDKIKAALYTLGWMVIFFFLPLSVISFSQLTFLYHSWFNLLHSDIAVSYGLSVAGWLNGWFHLAISKNVILTIGILLLLTPLLKTKYHNNINFKLLYLSFLLIWVVIFNYKAESPTYIIAVTGVALWFFTNKMSTVNIILAVFVYLFTVLSYTDIFPAYIKHNIVTPYALKAVPCIFVWFKIFYELLLFDEKRIITK